MYINIYNYFVGRGKNVKSFEMIACIRAGDAGLSLSLFIIIFAILKARLFALS